MSDERKRALMVALLVILALVAAWRLMPGWLDDEGGAAGRTGRSSGAAGAADAVQVTTLDLEALTAEPLNHRPGRNPFTYYQPPPPPPPPGPTAEELARRAAEAQRAREEQQRQQAEAPPPEPPKPQPPPFQLSYLGSFGPQSRRIAVFSDGEQIYNAVVGDVLDDKFVVADIGYESVTITYVGFPEEPATRVGIGG